MFEEIDKIEKSSDYAIITDREYVTATEKIVFEDLVKNKISKDGHKIKTEMSGIFHRYVDFIVFSYKYKTENRFLGINNSNNCWAVGVISLDDLSIEIHYLKNKYETLNIAYSSNTHLCFNALDKDSVKDKDKYSDGDFDSITLNRTTEEITTGNYLHSPPEIIGKEAETYENPKTFIYSGETYTVYDSSIWDENGEIVARLNGSVKPVSFEYSDVLLLSPELREINAILGEVSDYEIAAFFFTNGEDLFVGFVTDMSMFGVQCNLTCPVIFKTDLNFDSFEYIGCVSQNYMTNFYFTVQIDKIN